MTDQEIGERNGVVRLSADNFTPVERTPWGGQHIAAIKGLSCAHAVGESWELSAEPSFVAHTEGGVALPALLARDPGFWLGAGAAEGASLLVKLLDAAEALSVQIHPPDDDPTLGPGESGKPEAWYVIAAAPGAGIYLGLTEAGSEVAFRAALARTSQADDVSSLLTFVPVRAGDFFRIDAGTPHCVGPGVFLVEPQRVSPRKRGVTYRYWDWNRTYDGVARPLDVERALAVTRWDRPRGAALLKQVRLRAGAPSSGAARCESMLGPAPEGPALASDALVVARLSGTGTIALPDPGVLGALTVLDGVASVGGLDAGPGRTLAVAAGAVSRQVTLENAHAIFSAALP